MKSHLLSRSLSLFRPQKIIYKKGTIMEFPLSSFQTTWTWKDCRVILFFTLVKVFESMSMQLFSLFQIVWTNYEKDLECFHLCFVLIKFISKWNDVERSFFFSRSLNDLKRCPCGIELLLFRPIWTNYENA